MTHVWLTKRGLLLRKAALLGIATLILSGCAASSSYNYLAPDTSGKVKNNVVLDEEFETVWSRLVKNLSADFFVINNIEKASRLINLSFSSSKPSEYIDCGTTNRQFKNIRGVQNYSYSTADSSRFAFTDARGIPFNVVRDTNLEGRVNIYVAPDGGKTLVRVNSRYILGIKVSSYDLAGRPAGTAGHTWAFNTNKPYSQRAPSGTTIECTTNFEIEGRILRAAGAKL